MPRYIRRGDNRIVRGFRSARLVLELKISLLKKDVDGAIEVWEKLDDETQTVYTKDFDKMLELCGKDTNKLSDLWTGTHSTLQEEKLLMTYKAFPKNLQLEYIYLLPRIIEKFGNQIQNYNLWNIIDGEVKKYLLPGVVDELEEKNTILDKIGREELKEILPKIIKDVVKIDLMWVIVNLNNIDDTTQNIILEEVGENIENYIGEERDNMGFIPSIWMGTTKEIQKKHANLFEIIMQEYPDFAANIWCDTDDTIQKANANMFIELIKKAPERVWMSTTAELQEANANLIEEIMKGSYMAGEVWRETSEKIQEEKIEKIIKDNPQKVEAIWKNTPEKIKEEKIEKIIAQNPDKVHAIWSNTPKEIQEEKVEKIMKDNPKQAATIWSSTPAYIQRKKIEKIITENPEQAGDIWLNTDKRIQEENANLLPMTIEKNPEQVVDIWLGASQEIRLKNANLLPLVIEKNPKQAVYIWSSAPKGVQELNADLFMGIIESYPDEARDIIKNTSGKIIIENIKNICNMMTLDEQEAAQLTEKILRLYNKNSYLFKELDWDFIKRSDEFKLNEEQLLRITNYSEIQEFIIRNIDNAAIKSVINFIMNNDTNWIISLDTIKKNECYFTELIENIAYMPQEVITDDIQKQLIAILSDTDNYFDIYDLEDINGYLRKKEAICLQILEGNFEEIPETLKNKNYSKNNLYKFALLEYKLGINIEDAEKLIEKYGEDTVELAKIVLQENFEKYKTASDYLSTMKAVLECENIEKYIKETMENGTLGKPWDFSVSSRNIEGEILNFFAEIYNDTLYQLKDSDKEEQQVSCKFMDVDGNEIEKKIEVYTIKDDFNLNVRLEGAYNVDYEEPENWNDYYEQPNILNHGNCESYIGNDSISVSTNSEGVVVGYSTIGENCLIAAGSYDLGTMNIFFSSYDMGNEIGRTSNFRTPKKMIDFTRHDHNEMVKERIIIDDLGNVIKYKPNYAVYIEEVPKSERIDEWREKDPLWIKTKKLAAQLGIPIVVIDREYFAERETKKVEILKNLITGKDIHTFLTEEEASTYAEFIKEYQDKPKPELITELFTKYENNRTGLYSNEKLDKIYFTQDKLERIMQEIKEYINGLPFKEAKECMQAMLDLAERESTLLYEGEATDIQIGIAGYYDRVIKQTKEELLQMEIKKEEANVEIENQDKQPTYGNDGYAVGEESEILRNFLGISGSLYKKKKITHEDTRQCKNSIAMDMHELEQPEDTKKR